MVRTGMIRLGSTLLILAFIEAPSTGALIRQELSSAFFADSGPSAWWDLARDAGGPGPAPALDARGEFPGWPALVAAREDEPRVGPSTGPVHPGWTLSDLTGARAHATRPAISFREDAEPFPDPGDGPAAEPPLTLAGFLGVAAWSVYRRCSGRRPTASVRRLAPARATGTAIVPASRPVPSRRPPAPRPGTSPAPVVAARPLVLPARFVEVSTTTLPARRPAVGATPASVRRRGSVRRIPA